MSKHTTKQPESAEDLAREAFTISLKVIRDEIRAIESGKTKPKKHTPTETCAYLAKQAASINAELRKVGAEERRRSSEITKAIVLDWARMLDKAERAQLIRELQDLDTKRSGLA